MLELPFRQNIGHVKEREKVTAKHGPLHDLESVPKLCFRWEVTIQVVDLNFFNIAALHLPIPRMPDSACY